MSRRRAPARSAADREYFIALGSRLLREGHVAAACKAFADAGAIDRLIALGNHYVKKGMPSAAKLAYVAAGHVSQRRARWLRTRVRLVERTVRRSRITRC